MNTINELSDFHYCFKVSRKVVFKVNYYRLGGNKFKRFSTSAAQLNHINSDYNHCGQAQESLLPINSKAMNFYQKWDFMHIKDLSARQHAEILKDIEDLKQQYPHIQKDSEIGFYSIANLVRQENSKRKTA